MYLRVELQDLRDETRVQSATMFNWWAEKFLGLNAQQLTTMDGKAIDTMLELKLDQSVVVRVNVKVTSSLRMIFATIKTRRRQ